MRFERFRTCFRSVIALLIALVLAVAFVPVPSYAQDGEGEAHGELLYSGTCGLNAEFCWYEDGYVQVTAPDQSTWSKIGALNLHAANLADGFGWVFVDSEGTTHDGKTNTADFWDFAHVLTKETPMRTLVVKDGVTHIESSVFVDCDKLETAVLPEHMSKINDAAFAGAERLKNVVLPKTVDYDGSGVFSNTLVSDITLPLILVAGYDGNDLCSYTFGGGQSLKRLVIQEGVTCNPGSFADAIYKLTIPASIECLELPSTLDPLISGQFDDYCNLTELRISGDYKVPEDGKNLFTNAFVGDVRVYYEKGAQGFAFGKKRSIANPSMWLGVTPEPEGAPATVENAGHVTLLEICDFADLPDAADVTLADAQAIHEARWYYDNAGPKGREWAGDYARLLAAEATLDPLELPQVKQDSIDVLIAKAAEATYRAEQDELVGQILEDGSDAISNATTCDQARAALTQALEALEAVPTDEQLTAQELAELKAQAKQAISEYLDATLYREAEAQSLAAAVEAGQALVDAAENASDVEDALLQARAGIDELNLKTDAQLTAEELAAAKSDAKAQLDASVDLSAYRPAEASVISAALQSAKEAIDAATDKNAVAAALAAGKTKVAALDVKTAAELESAEQAQAAKAQQEATSFNASIAKIASLDALDDADAAAVAAARAAYEALSPAAKALVPASQLQALAAAEETLAGTLTVNVKKVTAQAIAKALKASRKQSSAIKRVVLGKKTKKLAKASFKKLKSLSVIVVKTSKLTKASVKGSLKGSKVKNVLVRAGSAAANKKLVKKYKKIFTKTTCGKKVKVA